MSAIACFYLIDQKSGAISTGLARLLEDDHSSTTCPTYEPA